MAAGEIPRDHRDCHLERCGAPADSGLRAESAAFRRRSLRHQDFGSREEYDLALVAELRRHQVTLVCLAGFMRLLGAGFL